MTAKYRLLAPHYINNVTLPYDAIVTEGVEVPTGWVPSVQVDPLNTDAVNAFYAAGPRGAQTYIPFNQAMWGFNIPLPAPPATYWQKLDKFRWKLTGLGAALAPRGYT